MLFVHANPLQLSSSSLLSPSSPSHDPSVLQAQVLPTSSLPCPGAGIILDGLFAGKVTQYHFGIHEGLFLEQ